MIDGISIFIVFIVSIFIHELGHALVALHEGIFGKFGVSKVGPCVRLTEPFKHRLDYLSGFLMELILLPFWIFSGAEWWVFIIIALGMSGLDILVIPFYGRLREVKLQKLIEFQQEVYQHANRFDVSLRKPIRTRS